MNEESEKGHTDDGRMKTHEGILQELLYIVHSGIDPGRRLQLGYSEGQGAAPTWTGGYARVPFPIHDDAQYVIVDLEDLRVRGARPAAVQRTDWRPMVWGYFGGGAN